MSLLGKIQHFDPELEGWSEYVERLGAVLRGKRNCRVIHTTAYFKGTLPFVLKGRFYAMVAFYPKGKILRQS